MLYLTSEIQAQFSKLVAEVDWLSEATKETARNKLDAMIHNIGYPDLVLNDTELATEIAGVSFSEIKQSFIKGQLYQLNYISNSAGVLRG